MYWILCLFTLLKIALPISCLNILPNSKLTDWEKERQFIQHDYENKTCYIYVPTYITKSKLIKLNNTIWRRLCLAWLIEFIRENVTVFGILRKSVTSITKFQWVRLLCTRDIKRNI